VVYNVLNDKWSHRHLLLIINIYVYDYLWSRVSLKVCSRAVFLNDDNRSDAGTVRTRFTISCRFTTDSPCGRTVERRKGYVYALDLPGISRHWLRSGRIPASPGCLENSKPLPVNAGLTRFITSRHRYSCSPVQPRCPNWDKPGL